MHVGWVLQGRKKAKESWPVTSLVRGEFPGWAPRGQLSTFCPPNARNINQAPKKGTNIKNFAGLQGTPEPINSLPSDTQL